MDTLELAGKSAEHVSSAVKSTDSLEPVYTSLEAAVQAFVAQGGTLSDVVPGGDGASLSFARGEADGRALWRRYVEALRDAVCKGGEAKESVSQALTGAGTAAVTLILTSLGIPAIAAPVIAPVAGALIALGADAICKGNDDLEKSSTAVV